ncbi:MOXD1 homolog 2 isoform X1 [Polistes fuscatus]|uniref:MOXD1 homolog 2 isoform X1 n=1 Tax=Polistes fuscatus TaxID=30207 RepID=UPI001CA9AD96|nr:MOXD1 homolog 2 isoform X1 [Polistes fuscatus]XP_043495839.1 MOXD1 homolog 2 isoform X1 [Polistes fuscatus]
MKYLTLSFVLFLLNTVSCVEWKHSAILDNNFLVLWTPGDKEVTFEIQVKTLGYVGLGFKKEDGREGADMVIGWVDNNGQVHLQDRHMKDVSKDPEVDSSQDYRLLLGYENKTHTVLRFSRRYDTCDSRDLKITNDTMQVVWQYHAKEPASVAGVLPGHGAVKGSRPLYLVQRDTQPKRSSYNHESEAVLKTWDILNHEVLLPRDKDSLLWCQIIKMPYINRKHHVVKYEPVIEPGKNTYLHHMTLYECPSNNPQLEEASKTTGSICYKDDNATQCNTIAATWSLGSEQGFNFPPEAGYALYPDNRSRYFMLETQYINPQQLVNDNLEVSDSSGLRLYYTDQLRPHDAGILSIGIDPNWRHIIPPGQPEVVSEGHCITECTEQTIPNSGINMFAVIMHTHQLGRKIRFRQIRAGEELPPIASDTNYDPTYQEYRKLQRPVKVYPGDHLVAECTYSSESRSTITLGGLMTRQETCLISALYYPRIELSICYSLPSLPTVLQSLGVQKVIQDSSLVKIQEPKSLAGMTLEDRLISYDWETSFQSFQEATRVGTFMPLCWTSKGVLPGTESLVSHYPRILYSYEETNLACSDMGFPMDAESDEANAVERGQLVRSKVSRSSEGPTAASSPSISGPLSLPLILGTTLLIGLAAGLR